MEVMGSVGGVELVQGAHQDAVAEEDRVILEGVGGVETRSPLEIEGSCVVVSVEVRETLSIRMDASDWTLGWKCMYVDCLVERVEWGESKKPVILLSKPEFKLTF